MKLKTLYWYTSYTLLLFLVLSSFFIIWMMFTAMDSTLERDWPAYFWNLEIGAIDEWETDEDIYLFYNDDDYYSWEAKSAFTNSGIVYIQYYAPFGIQIGDVRDTHSTYKYGIFDSLNKNGDPYSKVPFYLIYNIKESKFAYLNAKKEIIEWDADFDRDLLKKLDISHSVHLGKYNFETSPHIERYTNDNKALFKKFNDYLNSQISK